MEKERLEKEIQLMEEKALAKIAHDPFRQGFHLTPLSGWMNDPNGLCFYKGNYHVFHQHSPLDPNRGNIFWGHFTSPDLIHWKKQPTFLYPVDSWDKDGVYSGSALACEDGLYLYYTGNVKHDGDYDYVYEGRGHNVGLAVTKDGIMPDSNACILENCDYPNDLSCHVRDPKVWQMDGKYYMVLGARTRQDEGKLLIFESDDRLHWWFVNDIRTEQSMGYMWECPDIFCVDGQWIVMTSPQGMKPHEDIGQNVYSCGYFPLYGDFRGDYELGAYHEADMGFDYYAPQTFEAPDGRRIVIGWMGMPDAEYINPTTENLWQQCLSIPRQLRFQDEKLFATPIDELKALRKDEMPVSCDGAVEWNRPKLCELVFENHGEMLDITIDACVHISYRAGKVTLSLSGPAAAGRTERFVNIPNLEKIQMFIDASSIEVFYNEGAYVMSTRFYPEQPSNIEIRGNGCGACYELMPMDIQWKE